MSGCLPSPVFMSFASIVADWLASGQTEAKHFVSDLSVKLHGDSDSGTADPSSRLYVLPLARQKPSPLPLSPLPATAAAGATYGVICRSTKPGRSLRHASVTGPAAAAPAAGAHLSVHITGNAFNAR